MSSWIYGRKTRLRTFCWAEIGMLPIEQFLYFHLFFFTDLTVEHLPSLVYFMNTGLHYMAEQCVHAPKCFSPGLDLLI